MIRKHSVLTIALFATTMVFSGVSADVAGIKSGAQMVKEVSPQVKNIDTADLKNEINTNPDLVLVDIRTFGEIKSMGGGIDATQNVNIPRGWLEFRISGQAQSKDTPIVVYCGGNIRSPLAAATLSKMGYSNVRNYADGFLGWRKAGNPIAKP